MIRIGLLWAKEPASRVNANDIVGNSIIIMINILLVAENHQNVPPDRGRQLPHRPIFLARKVKPSTKFPLGKTRAANIIV